MLGEPTRPANVLACDQAIFTSIRTPMGEGYRIIAASGRLRPEEKQVITRLSPSHDSLCWTPDEEQDYPGRLAAAFYALPTGRLCAALSQYAGEEHTGRGGHRVYTQNAIFEGSDFAKASFNAFVVLRSMVDAGLTEPKLKSPPKLPVLSLPLCGLPDGCATEVPDRCDDAQRAVSAACDQSEEEFWGELKAPWRCSALEHLLQRRDVIVNLRERWTECAEALLMGVPGPMRKDISFSAGIKYSVGRCHGLSVIRDENGATRSRIAGRTVEFVDPNDKNHTPQKPTSPWICFIERYWSKGDLVALSRRTSQAQVPVDRAGRDRAALEFEEIDGLASSGTDALLNTLAQDLSNTVTGRLSITSLERTTKVGRILEDRFAEMTWSDAKAHWPAVVALPRDSAVAATVVRPPLTRLLECALREHPLVAAEATLDLLRVPRGPDEDLLPIVDSSLKKLADWFDVATDDERNLPRGTSDSIDTILGELCRLQPAHPAIRRLRRLRAAATSPGPAP